MSKLFESIAYFGGRTVLIAVIFSFVVGTVAYVLWKLGDK